MEHAEHASHEGGHGHGGGNKIFGVTMALMGVFIALCGAKVGSERDELTRELMKQTQANGYYTSASTKYRVILIELEKLHAGDISQMDEARKAGLEHRFIELAMDYTKERTLSQKWEESYKPLVDAHFSASERYDHAQLFAELGIVMASLAVLLASRPAWKISVVLGVLCMLQFGYTYFTTRKEVHKSEVQVEIEHDAYWDLRNAHVGANKDEKVLEELDPGGKIRAEIENKSVPAGDAKAAEGDDKK
jgi:hypothetical protein